MGRSDGWHDRPRKWEPTSSDDLLKKRYTEMDRYRLDLNQQRFAHMGREERIQKFGSHIIPIHVPLDRGETIEAYEQRFVHWLAVRENVRLQDIRDPMAERSYRIQFANKNANESLDYKFQYRNWVPPTPPPSYRLEATESSTMRSSSDQRPRLKRLRGLESHEIQRSSTSVDTVSSDIFDPVEKRLHGEYDELNERVLMNNRVLEMSVKRLHQGSVDNIKEATAQQEEIQELRALIRQEMDNRDAALAMVIVYLWRKEIGDLEERIKSKDIANVPQVATKSHQHCAKIASDLVAKREELAKVKKQLDEQLEKRSSPPDSAHLSMAKELGEKIASLEHEIDQLISTRRQEFQTVLQCDEHVRHLIRTVLAKA
ncbi:hypothetical protein Poli38472_005913 [Pythium oligandrum]|uniref:Uncharacterized protein n=1 Tax=Pythium oligandrum TaxID=41045 RepID=A0A8K1FLN7_PYTOL|nr:hypothetical protein Poli38472_005913 [Pythium oligandrum]|eukprot:TMW68445.1 hypothetical protein Poli38472_005913 [Pythium oligandrum]